MKSLIPLIVFLSILLQGCFSNKNTTKDDAVFLQTIPVCNSPELCKKMWQAAGEWVDKYSPQGIDVDDEKMIRSEDKEIGSDDMEIVITKVKQVGGHYQIVIDNACTSTFGACTIERNNMLAFNKHLIALMPAKDKAKKELVFDADVEVKAWLKDYINAFNELDVVAFSKLQHFPVTLIEDNAVQILNTAEDVVPYLETQKSKLAKVNGVYIVLENLKVLTSTGSSLFVNALFSINDVENVAISGQKLSINLIKVDGALKMISQDVQH